MSKFIIIILLIISSISCAKKATVIAKPIELQPIYFDFDKSNINSDNQPKMISNSQTIKANNLNVIIEGNCDNRGTTEYNQKLGLNRSDTIMDYLINDGVKADNLTSISYGEDLPACTEQIETCYSKNRRVDLKISAPQ